MFQLSCYHRNPRASRNLYKQQRQRHSTLTSVHKAQKPKVKSPLTRQDEKPDVATVTVQMHTGTAPFEAQPRLVSRGKRIRSQLHRHSFRGSKELSALS